MSPLKTVTCPLLLPLPTLFGSFRLLIGHPYGIAYGLNPMMRLPKLKQALRARAIAPAKSDSAAHGPTDTLRSFDQGRSGPTQTFPHAPPGEVLRRTGDEMQETSAAAAEEFQAATTSSSVSLDVVSLPDEYDDAKMRGENIFSLLSVQADISFLCCPKLDPGWFSVPSCGYGLRSDRMVVRVSYCNDDTFGPHFDEMQDRCARHAI